MNHRHDEDPTKTNAPAEKTSAREKSPDALNGIGRAAIAFSAGLVLILAHVIIEGLSHSKTSELLATILKEVGFALIVSAIIWITFEYFSSHDKEVEWEARLKKMSNNVFKGVLLKNIPEKLWDAIDDAVFKQAFIRKNFEITFTFQRVKAKDAAGGSNDYLEADVVVSYDIHNISDIYADFPIRFGISGHHSKPALSHCKVKEITTYRDGQHRSFDLSNFDKEFHQDTKSNTRIFDTRETIRLPPRETASIRIHYASPKDNKDTEVLVSSFPSDGMRLNVVDNTGVNLVFGANSIHPKDLEIVKFGPSTRIIRFELRDHLLPHQGMFLNWSVPGESQ